LSRFENDIKINKIENSGEYLMLLGNGLFGIKSQESNSFYVKVRVDGNGNVLLEKKWNKVLYKYTNGADVTKKIKGRDGTLTADKAHEY